MICAWQSLLGILPQWLRGEVDRLGKTDAEQLRLRTGYPPRLVLPSRCQDLMGLVTEQDLSFIINQASRYSPWSAQSVGQGYLTSSGGHRIGICGEAILKEGQITGMRTISSLCIRIARDHRGIGGGINSVTGSVVILGPPGWGKTTLLRDMVRITAESHHVAVVDERGELFPPDFYRGSGIDILSGCPKPKGLDMVMRTMGPEVIAVDEITSREDCEALLECYGCGVSLMATAHAASVSDFCRRNVYKPLVEAGVFSYGFVLTKDKSYKLERIAA